MAKKKVKKVNRRKSNKSLFKKVLFALSILIILMAVAFGIHYYNKYTKTREFVSVSGKFSFRYPKEYPIVSKTGEELIKEYNYYLSYPKNWNWQDVEWVQFRKRFVPNDWPDSELDNFADILIQNSKDISKHFYLDKELKTLSDYKEELLKYAEKEAITSSPPKFEDFKISGIEAIHVTFNRRRGDPNFSIPKDGYVFFYKGDAYILSFNYNGKTEDQLQRYNKAKKIVLSTFKVNKKTYFASSKNNQDVQKPFFENPYAKNMELLLEVATDSLPLGWEKSRSYKEVNGVKTGIAFTKTLNGKKYEIWFVLSHNEGLIGDYGYDVPSRLILSETINTKQRNNLFLLDGHEPWDNELYGAYVSECLPREYIIRGNDIKAGCSLVYGNPPQLLSIYLISTNSDRSGIWLEPLKNQVIIDEFKQMIKSLNI